MSGRGFQRFVYRLFDPGEFGCAVAGATLQVDFLARQVSAASIERFVGEDWALDTYDAGVKARMYGPLLPGRVSLCLMLRDEVSSQYGLDLGEGCLLCNPPGVPIDGFIAPGFRAVATSVPLWMWEECRRLAGCRVEELIGFQVIPLPPGVYAELRGMHAEAWRCLQERDEGCMAPELAGLRLSRALATAAWEHAARQRRIAWSPRNRFRLARRAEGLMRERLGEPLCVPNVCLAMGVSRRELEYAFQTAFGESPRAFLESLRMTAVRRALVRSGGGRSVTDVALACGFSHLGRFSTRYRALFGESPSETGRGKDG